MSKRRTAPFARDTSLKSVPDFASSPSILEDRRGAYAVKQAKRKVCDMQQVLAAQKAKLGTEVGVSGWILIDQARIDAFADVTEDHQFIHVDPVRAAHSPFGTTIAHGFLTLSLASKLAVDTLGTLPGQTMGVNYGLNKVRFVTPVCSGDRIRGRFQLVDIVARDDASLVQTFHLTVEIEGKASPALVAEWLGMARFDKE